MDHKTKYLRAIKLAKFTKQKIISPAEQVYLLFLDYHEKHPEINDLDKLDISMSEYYRIKKKYGKLAKNFDMEQVG